MDATRAMRAMLRSSGLTSLEVSRRIGRKDNYMSSLLSRGSSPQADTLATIAEACGYKLCLVGEGRTIDLDGWDVEVSQTIAIDGSIAQERVARELERFKAGERPEVVE